MFVGCPDDHPAGTYRMMSLNTWKVSLSRDVHWLNKSHGEHVNTKRESSDNGSESSIEELDTGWSVDKE